MKFIPVILLLLFVSCRANNPIVLTEYKNTVTEKVRDSVVIVPPDSSWLKALLECDSIGKVRVREILDYRSGKNIQLPKAEVVENIMYISAKVDSFSIYLKWKEKYELHQEQTIKTKYVKEYGFFYKVGLVATLLICILVIIYLVKNKLKFLK